MEQLIADTAIGVMAGTGFGLSLGSVLWHRRHARLHRNQKMLDRALHEAQRATSAVERERDRKKDELMDLQLRQLRLQVEVDQLERDSIWLRLQERLPELKSSKSSVPRDGRLDYGMKPQQKPGANQAGAPASPTDRTSDSSSSPAAERPGAGTSAPSELTSGSGATPTQTPTSPGSSTSETAGLRGIAECRALGTHCKCVRCCSCGELDPAFGQDAGHESVVGGRR